MLPTSPYADICWVALLGPVGLLLYRLLVAHVACDNDWVYVARDELLVTLGMNDDHAAYDLAFHRLHAYDLAVRRGPLVKVRPLVPAVSDKALGWLPMLARQYHDDMLGGANAA